MNMIPASLVGRQVSMLHPQLAEMDGSGVVVAVIDSGVHATHPHIGGIVGGIGISADGSHTADFQDRWGHGTAVTAVIRERAPLSDLHVARVFDAGLSTTSEALAAGLDWAIDIGAQVVNLSLGTANVEQEPRFASILGRAAEHNVWVVSASEHDDAAWLPGSMEGAVGVVVDWECERTTVAVGERSDGTPCLKASGYPRPIPGLPPERNLRGVSFSVANSSALLTRIRQARPEDDLANALAAFAQ
jgi:subtilisin family serine protease